MDKESSVELECGYSPQDKTNRNLIFSAPLYQHWPWHGRCWKINPGKSTAVRRSAFLPHSTDICWLHIHTYWLQTITHIHTYICIHFPNPDPSPPSLWPASLTSGSVTSAAGLAAGPDGCLLELDYLPCCKVVCLWCIMCFCCWGVFPVLTLYSPRSIVWGLFFSSSLSSCCYAVFFFKNPCISLLIVLCMIVYVTNKPTLTLICRSKVSLL